MSITVKKSSYSAPVLRSHGSIEKITQSVGSGRKLDASFAVGTNVEDLTFS